MEYGVHLPLIDFSGKGFSLAELRAYAKRASDLGYTFLCANDRLENTVITPHLGYVGVESYQIFYGGMVDDIRAWLAGAPINVMSAD